MLGIKKVYRFHCYLWARYKGVGNFVRIESVLYKSVYILSLFLKGILFPFSFMIKRNWKICKNWPRSLKNVYIFSLKIEIPFLSRWDINELERSRSLTYSSQRCLPFILGLKRHIVSILISRRDKTQLNHKNACTFMLKTEERNWHLLSISINKGDIKEL